MNQRILGTLAAASFLAVLGVVATVTRSDGQASSTDKLTIAIYTPTVQFANSAARLSYVQSIAKAVSQNIGVRVDGLSFTSLGQLTRSKPDFAIIDAQCYATNLGWQLLARARIDGSTARPWALYSSIDGSIQSLRGKKLAMVNTGCNDSGFVENAMLDGEVDMSFFGDQVSKSDLGGAVAEVATYKGAQAVFSPIGSQKGLTRVFDIGPVPNPAFVQLNSRLSDTVVAQVRYSLRSFRGGGAIDGWAEADIRPYRELRAQMGKRVKQGLFAAPDPVQVDADDVLIAPSSLGDVAFPGIRQHFEKPPERQE